MTVALVVLSWLLAAEFLAAPVNLWTGRTIGNFVRYTGLPPGLGTRVLAPLSLATGVALLAGPAMRALDIVGGAAALAISCFYLVCLAAPGRRDPAGLFGFAVFGALACALLAVRLAG